MNPDHHKHLFISYCTAEAEFALKLAADLKNSGVKVWIAQMDGAIQGGDDWRHSIEQALSVNACIAFVPVLSPSYVRSEYCQKELGRANRLKIAVYPLVLHFIPDEVWPIEVERLQFISFEGSLSPQAYNENFQLLLQTVKSEFPEQMGDIPNDEVQYLNNLIVELELRRGVLEYVELAAEISEHAETSPFMPYDEWGFSELIKDSQRDTSQVTVFNKISDVTAKYPSFVLIGEPGTGKTTAVRRLVREAAQKRLTNPYNNTLPLLIYLPQWDNKFSFSDFLKHNWPLKDDLDTLLRTGNVFLYLDGLNEMGAEGSQKIEYLKDWLSSTNKPKRFIVTCRAGDYAALNLGQIPIISTRELDVSQIRDYSQNYLKDKADKFLSQLLPSEEVSEQIRLLSEDTQRKIEAYSLLRLSRNPYMLSALLIIFEASSEGQLPRNMGILFSRLVQALWKREINRSTINKVEFTDLEKALSSLAFKVIDEEKSLDIPLQYALDELGGQEILQVAIHASYLVLNGKHVSFYHQLLLEYFAAVWINNTDIAPILQQIGSVRHSALGMYGMLATSKWDQVILSLSGFTNAPFKLLPMLVEVDTYLAARWITSGVILPHDFYKEILSLILREPNPQFAARTVFPVLVDANEFLVIEPLIKLLAHENFFRVGSRAANELTRIGAEAVPLLINEINNPNSAVRARVTRILVNIRDERSIPSLIDRLSDQEGDGFGKPTQVCDVAAFGLSDFGTVQALEAFDKWRFELINSLKILGGKTDARTLWSAQELFSWYREPFQRELSLIFDTDEISKLCDDVSETSIQILGLIGNHHAIIALEHILKSAADHDDERRIETILGLLARIGTPEAIEAQSAAARG